MRVLIVDDEPLVRIGIKSAIDWEANGMQIAGEAADGIEALRLMTELRPDVVILDIKMPKKDGLEVLSVMKQENIKAKVIILSSFDDFTFVKEAMKLGATDYFHKPSMNEQEIKQVLLKIKSEIEASHVAQEIDTGHRMQDQEKYYNRIFFENSNELQQSRLKEGNMVAVLFTVHNYSQVIKRYTEENASILPNTIMNLLSELLSREKEVEYARIEDHLFVILISHSETKSVQAAFSRVNDIVHLIEASLKRFANIDTVFGISEAIVTFGEAKQAIVQAKQSLEQKFYHPNEHIFYFKHRNTVYEQKLDELNTFIVAMKQALKDERYDEFEGYLTDWEQTLRKYECLNEKEVKNIYKGFMFMMENGEAYLEYRNKLEELNDFNECATYYRNVLGNTLKSRNEDKNKEFSPLIRTIFQYIEKYYNEDISLNRLGEQLHASPTYISRLFKQEVGRGLFTYINEIRILHAKELLKNYHYKIYEVAEMVGFNSQVHFAIVFNKFVGMSPKDYRKEHI